MRYIYLLAITLLSVTGATAQTPTAFSMRYPDNYYILSLNVGTFFPIEPGHDVFTSFPYMSQSTITGNRESKTFDGAVRNKFSNPMLMLGGTLESILKRNDIVLGAGYFQMNGGDHGFYLQGGYRYMLHMGALDLKPGMDFYYVSGVDRMGSIDNRQKDIYLPGYTAYDQFTVKESENYTDGDGNSYSNWVENTYDAERLDVNYRRVSYLLEPKTAISAHFGRYITVGLEVGFMVQVAQNSKIKFEQVNHAASRNYVVGVERQGQNGLLTGPRAAFTVGVNF